MNLHTDDTIRAETEYRREQLSRSWPKKRSRRKKREEKKLLKQPTPDLTSKDDSAIRRIVADIEHGFNNNDPELLARHIDDDALVVNRLGTVMRGRAAIEESGREVLVGGPLADATAHYRLTEMSLLAPNVAVAQKSAWKSRANADEGDPPQTIALYVFIHRDGRWWVNRRQNTEVG